MNRRDLLSAFLLFSIVSAAPAVGHAEAEHDRFGAGGYFRVMTRPDAQGGDGKLGYWNLYGRLMNEGPYAALEMKLDLLQQQPRSDQPWTTLHAKVEGGSIANADPRNGALDTFRLSQLYVQAGNVGLRNVTWQLGTLDYYFGDLGLYDMKPAEIFFDTVGLSATWKSRNVDVLVGAGDAGYFLRGANYDTVFSGGGMVRARLGDHFELGGGGEMQVEPKVVGNQHAPYATPNVSYADYLRHLVVKHWYDSSNEDFAIAVRPVPRASEAWKIVGYLGFGKLGPIQWNNFFVNYSRLLPDTSYTETCTSNPIAALDCTDKSISAGEPAKTYTIYVHDLTGQRYSLTLGDEVHFTIIPDRLDGAWAALYGDESDGDNRIAPSDFVRTYYSTVGRLQVYLSQTVHLLGETSIAREISKNGNTYRDHADSIFANSNGVSDDALGLLFGDDHIRDTWQGKAGVVINPTGYGVFTRPSIRVLYGVQYSTQNQAFGNSFSRSLADQNFFGTKEQHIHQMIGLEAEAWF